jgi:hypothetical protein
VNPPSPLPPPAARWQDARSLYATFHGFDPRQVQRRPCRRVVPPVLVGLGEVCGLIYRSDRGQSGRPRTFVHFFAQKPTLACDPGGAQLYLVGGRYRVTRRGLEG